MVGLRSFRLGNGREAADAVVARAPEEPLFPHFSGLPTAFDPRARRISEAAAGAAQYVIDLEAEIGRLKEENGYERNRNSLLDETNKILHEQVAALENENLRIRDSNSRTRTKLEVGAGLYIDALKEVNAWRDPDAPAEQQAEAQAEAPVEEPFGAPKRVEPTEGVA